MKNRFPEIFRLGSILQILLKTPCTWILIFNHSDHISTVFRVKDWSISMGIWDQEISNVTTGPFVFWTFGVTAFF